MLAALNHAEENHEVRNLIKDFKKPAGRPRPHSVPREDEERLYAATDACFRDFLSAAFHSGLRPFCELARRRPTTSKRRRGG